MRLACPECPHVVEADTRKAALRALDLGDQRHAQMCCCGWRREYRTSLTTDHRARLDTQRHAHTCEQHRAQVVADIDARIAALEEGE